MERTTVKPQNYYAVQGWMVTKLQLKGLEKEVYAIIYGFSQSNGQAFNGSIQYLADWTLSTKQGIIKTLKKLVEKGLLIKKEKYTEGGLKQVEYYATQLTSKLSLIVNSVHKSGKLSSQDQSTQLTESGKLSSPNNIDNINNNINNNIEETSISDDESLF